VIINGEEENDLADNDDDDDRYSSKKLKPNSMMSQTDNTPSCPQDTSEMGHSDCNHDSFESLLRLRRFRNVIRDHILTRFYSHSVSCDDHNNHSWLQDFEEQCRQIYSNHLQLKALSDRSQHELQQLYHRQYQRTILQHTIPSSYNSHMATSDTITAIETIPDIESLITEQTEHMLSFLQQNNISLTIQQCYVKVLRLLIEADYSGKWPESR
jgi:hypothetical protein